MQILKIRFLLLLVLIFLVTSTCKPRSPLSNSKTLAGEDSSNYDVVVKKYFTELSRGTCILTDNQDSILLAPFDILSPEGWQNFQATKDRHLLKTNIISGSALLKIISKKYVSSPNINPLCPKIPGDDFCALFSGNATDFFQVLRQGSIDSVTQEFISEFLATVKKGKDLLQQIIPQLSNSKVKSSYGNYAGEILKTFDSFQNGKIRFLQRSYFDSVEAVFFYSISDEAGELFEATIKSESYQNFFKEISGALNVVLHHSSLQTTIESSIKIAKVQIDDINDVIASGEEFETSTLTARIEKNEQLIKSLQIDYDNLNNFVDLSPQIVKLGKVWYKISYDSSSPDKPERFLDRLINFIAMTDGIDINSPALSTIKPALVSLVKYKNSEKKRLPAMIDLYQKFSALRWLNFGTYNVNPRDWTYEDYYYSDIVVPFNSKISEDLKLENYRVFDNLKLERNITILLFESFNSQETTAGFYTNIEDPAQKFDIKIVRITNKNLTDRDIEKTLEKKFNLKKIGPPNFSCNVANPDAIMTLPRRIRDMEIDKEVKK